ncbi:MAG TPA: di-heme oxidoredictase family protein [Polyangia bacterium]|nr:di-heme oxidoredictase family protein [Polyangia bacterium]
MSALYSSREIRSWLGATALSIALGGCGAQVDTSTPAAAGQALSADRSTDGDEPFAFPARARVVAQGIPGAGAIAQVGTFHRGSPFHDKAAFAALTAPGMILDGKRLLVASSSSFGATLSRPAEAPGCVLSLDVSQGLVAVPADLASAGGQAATADGRARVYANQDTAFLNSINNPAAATAALPAASLPLGLSLNRGFGRPWIANAPTGATGAGTITVDDPSGAPLAGAPSLVAGGVFSGDLTNRSAASTEGLDHGVVATALLTKSPDGSGKAVFLAAEADGSVVQVHVLKGVDGFAPAGTFSPLPALTVEATQSMDHDAVTRVGMVFNWVPTRIVYLTDPLANRVIALDVGDDGTLFTASAPREIRSRWFDRPVDLAAAVPEVASDNFASNTTLGGGSDLYVLNRGNATIVRVSQAGQVVAARRLFADLPSFRVNGITVSEDAQTIWVTAAVAGGGGVVLELPSFGEGFITPTMVDHARRAGATGPTTMGADMFTTELVPFQALGPLFNGRACGDCHNDPIQGGMGTKPETFVTRVGRISNGMFDPLIGLGGPVARAHSIAELGFPCGLRTGVPPLANVTSKRSAMTLRGTALIDFVQKPDILKAQAAETPDVRGKVNQLADGRLGRFGWKAQFATLVEFMGDAFTHEMGITNPLAMTDEVRGCGASLLDPEIDAVPVQAVTAFMGTLDPAVPASTCLAAAGAATFATVGCAGCHTPSFPGPGRTINLYSDLLVHDMGAAFDDHFVAGSAGGSEWRTAPLWRASERTHFLHDGRAASLADAIAAHGGQAAASAANFAALDPASRQALLDFLGCI